MEDAQKNVSVLLFNNTANKIKNIRTNRNLTLAEAAEKIGVSVSYLTFLENPSTSYEKNRPIYDRILNFYTNYSPLYIQKTNIKKKDVLNYKDIFLKENLKKLRDIKKISFPELSLLTGSTIDYLKKIENINIKRYPYYDVLIKLAEAYNITLDELLGEDSALDQKYIEENLDVKNIKNFSDLIKGLRIAKKISINKACSYFKVRKEYLKDLERANQYLTPSSAMLIKIADLYGVSRTFMMNQAAKYKKEFMENKNNELGDFLKKIRLEKNLTAKEVAVKSKISCSALSMLENPSKSYCPTKELLRKVSDFYGVDYNTLLNKCNSKVSDRVNRIGNHKERIDRYKQITEEPIKETTIKEELQRIELPITDKKGNIQIEIIIRGV